MKRVIVFTVSLAVFTTLFAGLAAAKPASDSERAHADVVVQVDDGGQLDGISILKRCRRLFGEDGLTAGAKERCIRLWKRWCDAHPRARHCPRPDPPPPCRFTDRVVDRRCVPLPCIAPDAANDRWCAPCESIDHVVDRTCIPCRVTDQVLDPRCGPHSCVDGDGVIARCVPVAAERPTDGPVDRTDRPLGRPQDKPADTRPSGEVLERPADEPAELRPDDRILERPVDRLTDRVGNDVHLRIVDADS
ncbi:MAG: hypothetical protein OEP52_03805 [Acidimicrobiia bacterium]|nr:hypothetical protein [Acidimicrobiia bacterium]